MIKTFDEVLNEYWGGLTFWEKVQFRWIDFWGFVECHYQLFMHKVFKVDWHKKDTDYVECDWYEPY